jgi:alpha-amylase/alpha-mannosidase (GH57 family)
MSNIKSSANIEFTITFSVTEEEARALDALAGYDVDQFIKAFYDHLGEAYMRPYEKGLRKFLANVRGAAFTFKQNRRHT